MDRIKQIIDLHNSIKDEVLKDTMNPEANNLVKDYEEISVILDAMDIKYLHYIKHLHLRIAQDYLLKAKHQLQSTDKDILIPKNIVEDIDKIYTDIDDFIINFTKSKPIPKKQS